MNSSTSSTPTCGRRWFLNTSRAHLILFWRPDPAVSSSALPVIYPPSMAIWSRHSSYVWRSRASSRDGRKASDIAVSLTSVITILNICVSFLQPKALKRMITLISSLILGIVALIFCPFPPFPVFSILSLNYNGGLLLSSF